MPIAHRIAGSGPVHVIGLHGWFGSSDGWGALPDLIDPAAYTYAFMDYRGYGQRQSETGEFTLEEISQDCQQLADELGWDTFAVLGHSMGGAAALRVFCDVPERVTAVIGVSPVPASGVPFDDDGRALFHGAAQQDENRYAILDLTTGNRLSSYWLQSMVEFSRKHSTPEAIAGYLTAWSEANFVAELPEVTVPVTAIVGEHDPALGADTMKATWLTHIPSCELVTMANAGHYAMNETPIALATHLEQALSGFGQ